MFVQFELGEHNAVRGHSHMTAAVPARRVRSDTEMQPAIRQTVGAARDVRESCGMAFWGEATLLAHTRASTRSSGLSCPRLPRRSCSAVAASSPRTRVERMVASHAARWHRTLALYTLRYTAVHCGTLRRVQFGVDFDLYSSYADAVRGRNPWRSGRSGRVVSPHAVHGPYGLGRAYVPSPCVTWPAPRQSSQSCGRHCPSETAARAKALTFPGECGPAGPPPAAAVIANEWARLGGGAVGAAFYVDMYEPPKVPLFAIPSPSLPTTPRRLALAASALLSLCHAQAESCHGRVRGR
jgi:hypothetical protein